MTTAHTDADRADFEAWAIEEAFPITRCFDDDGLYEFTATQKRWETWQADHRAPTDPAPDLWRGLMIEARDNCRASIAEDGISDIRRQYREGLLSRIDDALAAAPKSAEPAPGGLPKPDVQLCVVEGQLQPVVWRTLGAAIGKPLDLYTADTVLSLLMKQAWDRGIKSPDCHCEACDIAANGGIRSRMSLCPECRDKRCPRAAHHNNQCAITGATN